MPSRGGSLEAAVAVPPAAEAALINLFDYEAAARRRLPAALWDFVAAGAFDEVALRRNRSGFDALTLRSRCLRDVSVRSLRTTVLGTELALPVMLAPGGLQAAVAADGEVAAARGAARSGALAIVPMFAAFTLEEVARRAEGPLWFQLYHVSADLTDSLVGRAQRAGYGAVVLTVDGSAPAIRERDRRNGFDPWATGLLEANLADAPASLAGLSPREILALPRRVTWNDVARLRAATSLPVVLKGITTAEDARAAVEHGVDGIIVSTHGGRLVDTTPSSVESLPEVVDAVGDRVEIYLDSGIRRGSDALKALALGARAVGIGRPLYWGLAVDGADGVHAVLEILRAELDLALAYGGCADLADVSRAVVNVPPGFGTAAAGAATATSPAR